MNEALIGLSLGMIFLGLLGFITEKLVNKYGVWFPWETKMKEWAKQNPEEMNKIYKKYRFNYREKED